MSKKEAPGKSGTGRGSTHAAPSKPSHTEQTMSRSEITSFIEKTLSETLSKRFVDLQQELTKFTEQRLEEFQSAKTRSAEGGGRNVDVKIKELEEELLGSSSSQLKRIEKGEDAVRDLERRFGLLQEQLRAELGNVVEEKLRRTQQKVLPESETVEKLDQKWTAELADREFVHQEELSKLHQQHHQDMLSVINDCCRKLKSGFTRQDKPYDVEEIHAIIDDIEHKMVQEIFSEIQKTNTHEDLSSFEEALAKSELSGELGNIREQPKTMTTEDISAALGAFEDETFKSETFDVWSQELTPGDGKVEDYGAADQPVVEEIFTKNEATTTGDRGNPYYMEELKRTIDNIISGDEKAETAEENKEPQTPDFPQETRSYQDVEKSLESMILCDDSASGGPPAAPTKEKVGGVLDSHAVADTKKSEKQPPKSTKDVDQLKSLEAMVEADPSYGKIPPGTSGKDRDQLMSLEGMLETDASGKSKQPPMSSSSFGKTPSGTSAKDRDQLMSLEGMLETDASGKSKQPPTSSSTFGKIPPGTSAKDRDQLMSLEGMLETDASGKTKQPPTSSSSFGKTPSGTSAKDRDQLMSLEGMLETDASGKSKQPPTSSKDADQMKSLEAMIEDSIYTDPDKNKSKDASKPVQPTNPARQEEVKASLSRSAVTSALPREEMHTVHGTGYQENPHYVEEIVKAVPAAKENPKTGKP